jgi:cysteinyl-tRNA synthetase
MGRAIRAARRCGSRTDRPRQGLTDEAIDALVAERTQAKKQRNFARADQIRNELAEKGIVIEDSKDGVRWKRK